MLYVYIHIYIFILTSSKSATWSGKLNSRTTRSLTCLLISRLEESGKARALWQQGEARTFCSRRTIAAMVVGSGTEDEETQILL